MSEKRADEMDILLAEKELTFGTKRVVVKKYSLLDTVRLAASASGIVNRIVKESESFSSAISKIMINTDDSTSNGIKIIGAIELFDLIGDDGIVFLRDAISKATTLDLDEIEELGLDEGIEVVMEIYKVNKSFFMKSMNKVKKAIPNVKPKKHKELKTEEKE